MLQEIKHAHIIGLLDVFGHRSNVSLVFDFMDTDLEQIIKDTSVVLTPGHIKAYILMTLQGLEHLHLLWILHRVCVFGRLIISKMKEINTLLFLSPKGFETKQLACK